LQCFSAFFVFGACFGAQGLLGRAFCGAQGLVGWVAGLDGAQGLLDLVAGLDGAQGLFCACATEIPLSGAKAAGNGAIAAKAKVAAESLATSGAVRFLATRFITLSPRSFWDFVNRRR
jgi:hypothetical protein